MCALLALALSTPALGPPPLARLRASFGETGRPPRAPADPKAQALFEFLMARRMEAAGDTAGALAALERARKLDPASAEIAAEIAGNHSRQDRMAEAVAAGEQALKLDKDNVEAHHVLAAGVFGMGGWRGATAVGADHGRRPRRGRSNISPPFNRRRSWRPIRICR